MRERLYIASVSQDAARLAAEYGIGLELDHYCTAENMDGPMAEQVHQQVLTEIDQAARERRGEREEQLPLIFHAPFNELHPAAIDPKIKAIAYQRYQQAYCLAKERYQIHKMIVHSGYMPYVYYKVWHQEKSVEFWERYMEDKPENFTICIENVLEDEPNMMVEIVEKLQRPNVKLCLDLGHANCMSRLPAEEWIRVMGPRIGHLHIHNNDGTHDQHNALSKGTLDMERILEDIDRYCEKTATITIESLDGRASLQWLKQQGYLK